MYNFFDKIYCINLKHRTDRYNSSLKTFIKLNINNVKYFLANKHPKGGRYGCFESHINVIHDAYINNYNYILIFEDDVKIAKYYNNLLLNKSINFMKTNNNWDIFYLGYFPFSYNYKYNIISDNIIESNPFGGHAYCLNKQSIKLIIDNYHNIIGKQHFDIWLSLSNKFRTFCIAPIIFDQYFRFKTDNSTHGIAEYMFRKKQYLFEDYNINSNFSLYIYNFHKNKLIIFILLLFIVFIYLKKIDNNIYYI
jgi:glycosyl transferase family 25